MSGVVGLDLSLTSTGIAGITPPSGLGFNLGYGKLDLLCTVKSSGKKGDTLEQRRDRLYHLANQIVWTVESHDPELVVIESPSYGSKFGSPHDRSGLWWLVVNAVMADEIPVAQVSPQGRAKYGTGAGNSAKSVVEAFVREFYQDIAPRRIANNDEADAVLLAAMGARRLGYPVEPERPGDANLAAMDGVLW